MQLSLNDGANVHPILLDARAGIAQEGDDVARVPRPHCCVRHIFVKPDLAPLDKFRFGSEDGEAVPFVEEVPERPNPVTQDEMDAGSVELF